MYYDDDYSKAGFHTTIISYLSIFYRRYEFGRRLSVLLCSSGLLGTFANIFVAAYAPRGTAVPPPLPPPAKVHSRSSFKDPWTVLFITETVIFIVLGLVASVWLPNDVDTAWFLRPESRESAKRRIYHDRQESAAETSSALSSPPPPSFPGSASPDERGDDSEDREEDSGYIEDEELDDEEVNERSRLMGGFASRGQSHPSSLNLTIASSSLTQDRGLTRSELLSGILFLPLVLPVLLLTVVSSVPTVAFPAFLSFILSSYETSSRLYGSILTVPPFVVASVVLFFVASWSDRHHQRFLPILKGFFMVVVGLISTLVISLPIFSSNHTITAPLYISLCILLAGSLVPGLLLTVWLCDNLPVPGKRALVLGIHGYTSVLSIPFYSFTYTGNENRPRLMVLVLVICSCVAASLLGIIGIRAYVVRLNIGRAKLAARYSLESENTSASDREIWLRAVQQAPRFAIIGGSWWDDNVRFFIGHKLLRLDIDQAYERRGDESVTYEYEL